MCYTMVWTQGQYQPAQLGRVQKQPLQNVETRFDEWADLVRNGASAYASGAAAKRASC